MPDFHESLDKALEHAAETVEPLQECERCRVMCAPGMACVSTQPGHANAERPCREPRQALENGVRDLAADLRRRTTDHLATGRGIPYYPGPWVADELEKLLNADDACRRCGRTVPGLWRRSDEWRNSHYCAPCLWGDLPGGAS